MVTWPLTVKVVDMVSPAKKITTTSYLSNIHPTSNSKRHYF